MKRLLLTASAVAFLSTQALAWNGTNTGSGQLVEQGSANQANSSALSLSSSASHANANATGGRASAVGGTVNVNGAGGGSGGAGSSFLAVPSASAAGGIDCPVIGPGIGGQSGLAAGVFSWGYISPDCNKRRTAMELYELFGPAVARAYAERNIDGVAEAVRSAQAVQPVAVPTTAIYPFDYCQTASPGELKQHKECIQNRKHD